jgi:hypothetical protein
VEEKPVAEDFDEGRLDEDFQEIERKKFHSNLPKLPHKDKTKLKKQQAKKSGEKKVYTEQRLARLGKEAKKEENLPEKDVKPKSRENAKTPPAMSETSKIEKQVEEAPVAEDFDEDFQKVEPKKNYRQSHKTSDSEILVMPANPVADLTMPVTKKFYKKFELPPIRLPYKDSLYKIRRERTSWFL